MFCGLIFSSCTVDLFLYYSWNVAYNIRPPIPGPNIRYQAPDIRYVRRVIRSQILYCISELVVSETTRGRNDRNSRINLISQRDRRSYKQDRILRIRRIFLKRSSIEHHFLSWHSILQFITFTSV